MTTFAITSSDQVIGSVNYLLSNLGQSGNVGNITIPTGTLIGNTTSGIVSTYNTGNSNAYSYLYQWVNLRYANNATGTSGFSTVPTNSDYFGVYNSVTSAASSVPAAYTWYQVAGGFGTTKFIFYSTQGGRQVQLFPANVAPSSSFIQSTANVAIDLDIVTTAAGTPGERGPIAMAYVVTPSTPVGASDLQLTAWWESARDNLIAPIGTGLIPPVVGDTGTFIYGAGVGTPSETYEYNGSGWVEVVPQVISGNVIVANSAPGSIITANTLPANAVVYQSLTNDQIANSTIIARNIQTNTITGDKLEFNTITGNRIAGNTIVATNIQTGTITATQIAGSTITANQIAANTITATQISTSYLYTGNIVSTGATLGSNTSSGYWLRYSDGAARFGGNVSIGNNAAIGSNVTIGGNLTVGANAVIGSNLSVVGLVTAGALLANTVSTNTVVPASISTNVSATSNSNVTIGVQVNNSAPTYGYVLAGPITVVPTTSNNTIYISGAASVYATWTVGNPTQYFLYQLWRNQPGDSPGVYNNVYNYESPDFPPAIARDFSVISWVENNVLPSGTYTYFWSIKALVSSGTSTRTTTISTNYNALIGQVLKR
jgi:acetyltransferase-like isoleucine patch superfamily enzyme